MANLEFVTDNKLTDTVNAQKKRTRIAVLSFGVPFIVLAAIFVHPFAGLFFFVIIYSALRSARGSDMLRAGAAGEDLALRTLSQLPDKYTLFNQVDLPNPRSRSGVNEADLIVVGPEAIFVVEVKHNNGAIQGAALDKEWVVNKVGRGGTPYAKSMRNPIKQVKHLVWLLSSRLNENGIKTWVQGVVVFTNSSAKINIRSENDVPVLRIDQLLEYVITFNGKGKPTKIKVVNQHIASLKAA